jgi:hypothetical protein
MATAVILDTLNNKTKRIDLVNFPIVKILQDTREVRINEILPFRVQFRSIQIEPFGPGNIPAIPLQVIGYSNYIL